MEVAVGTFGVSRMHLVLPGWLNTIVALAGVAASLERAFTLRNHWLIDLDTWWLG